MATAKTHVSGKNILQVVNEKMEKEWMKIT